MQQVIRKARAKINLGLDVVKRREDGYHEVKMIMQTVDLFDELTICKTEQPGIQITTNVGDIPVNEDNLIYKTAKLMLDKYSIQQGIAVHLKKVIPVAAGMAGGSTDAAATFTGLNQLFDLKIPDEELMKMAVKIGADVPYCIMRGTALSEGIGEILNPLPPMPRCPILIAKPAISVSTKYVYENLHANELKEHPDIDGIVEAIKAEDIKGVASKLENVLETVTEREYPVITELKDFMKSHGALNAIMSGSGPTVFGIYDREDVAAEAYRALKAAGIAKQVFLTETFN